MKDQEEEHTSQTDNDKTFNVRGQQGLYFTIKWEMQFPWTYYGSKKVGWFCKTCDIGDQY